MAKDLEKARVRSARWRARNPEKIKAAAVVYRKTNKEKCREYYWHNVEQAREYRRQYHKKNRDKLLPDMRERGFRRLYGISVAERDAMIAERDGKCDICRKVIGTSRTTHIDHCHGSDVVRGILCVRCNTALGWYENNRDKINEYLAGKTNP
jgi:hypothetical protein